MVISVVVPVYNVKEYLKECVDSIISQDFHNTEIILVDDGSTDGSGLICDEYEQKYNNINVIHKTNGGLSDARNAGIKASKGDYILFVDSDDYIGINTIGELIKSLEQNKMPDVVFLETYKVYPDKRKESLGDKYDGNYINGRKKEVVMNHIASLPKFPGSACSKLVKTDLIKENNLYFEKDLLSEDIDWTIGLLLKAESFAYCDVPYYYYRQNRMGSITNSFSTKTVESLLYIIRKWASKENVNNYQKQINAFLAYEYVVAIYNYDGLKNTEKEKMRVTMKEYQWILEYGQSLKTKISSIAVALVGIDKTAKLLSFYKRAV